MAAVKKNSKNYFNMKLKYFFFCYYDYYSLQKSNNDIKASFHAYDTTADLKL